MYLIITIDTEEDNWGDYKPTNHTVENIKEIPRLQELFDEFEVKPTYLITYPVAKDPQSVSILKKILDEGKCEIGTHCHPWNTPPFEEKLNEKNSMLNNLSAELQFKKIKNLHEEIIKNFGITPVSFRGGRWGFNEGTALAISKLGYKVDSSITPYTTWYEYHGPDYSDVGLRPYRFSAENILRELENGQLIEIPVSIGFLQKNYELANKINKKLNKNNTFKLIGILSKLRLLNKIWLSPELSSEEKMIDLAKIIMGKNIKILNMTFHSVSLKRNLFTEYRGDEEKLFYRIRGFLLYIKNANIKSITLSEVIDLIKQSKI